MRQKFLPELINWKGVDNHWGNLANVRMMGKVEQARCYQKFNRIPALVILFVLRYSTLASCAFRSAQKRRVTDFFLFSRVGIHQIPC